MHSRSRCPRCAAVAGRNLIALNRWRWYKGCPFEFHSLGRFHLYFLVPCGEMKPLHHSRSCGKFQCHSSVRNQHVVSRDSRKVCHFCNPALSRCETPTSTWGSLDEMTGGAHRTALKRSSIPDQPSANAVTDSPERVSVWIN